MSLGSVPFDQGADRSADQVRFSQPTFLMCPPTLYDVQYVINPWMEGNVHRSSRDKAMEQWARLHDALAQVACVELVNPDRVRRTWYSPQMPAW